MMKVTHYIVAILISIVVFGSISFGLYALQGIRQPAKQDVLFLNHVPGTMLGLVKFALNENDKPINYTVLNTWATTRKILELEPGYYGVTQYNPKLDTVIDYKMFWVKDQPVILFFGG